MPLESLALWHVNLLIQKTPADDDDDESQWADNIPVILLK